MEKEKKIAIIGAGASGLTAAHTLRKLGYRQITVFEREGRVGGKVCSYKHDEHVYELGAVWSTQDYKTILDFAKYFDVKYAPAKRTIVQTMQGKAYSYPFYIFKHFKVSELASSLIHVIKVLRRFPLLNSPGFSGLHPDLHLTFSEFSKKYHIESFSKIISSFCTGCGYGYYDQVPAMYLLKLIPWIITGTLQYACGLRRIELVCFTNGWQGLWERIAERFDVRLNAHVESIQRYQNGAGPKVEITADGKTEVFDRVVVSCLLHRADHLINLTDQERELFGKINYHRYMVTLAEGRGMKHVTILDNVTPDTIGHVIAVGHFHQGTNVYSLYQLLPEGMSQEQAMAQLDSDVKDLGGRVDRIITQRHWEYFPYVTTTELNQGYYDRLERLQGVLGTYYVGGLMNFETVEHTSRYAKHLMEKNFGSAAAPH